MSETREPQTDYFHAVETFDAHRASDVVLNLADGGIPLRQITTQVLAPAQVRVGELWETGVWSVADEHVATSITEAALSALVHAAMPRSQTRTPHVAVACAEGEWHSLPARMAAVVAGSNGEVRVTMLGASMPASQLQRRLSAGDIDVLALSCTMPTSFIGAARCIAAAHDLGVPVVIGGRALGINPHRAHRLGADDWAIDARALSGPVPQLAGRTSEISAEVLLLDAVDDTVLSLAHHRVLGAFPQLSRVSPYLQASAKEDLRWMARYAAAALLADDETVVEGFLAWLCGTLRDRVPPFVITTSAQLLAETLEPQTAAGAAMLRQAASTVGQAKGARDDDDLHVKASESR